MKYAGLRVKPVSRVRPFTRNPLPWNTYTGLDLPLQDFGFIGALVGLAAVGILLGGLWRAALFRWRHALLLYPIAASAAVASSIQFNFTAPQLLGAMIMTSVLLMTARASSPFFSRKLSTASRVITAVSV